MVERETLHPKRKTEKGEKKENGIERNENKKERER